jgi:hypothetical protein
MRATENADKASGKRAGHKILKESMAIQLKIRDPFVFGRGGEEVLTVALGGRLGRAMHLFRKSSTSSQSSDNM